MITVYIVHWHKGQLAPIHNYHDIFYSSNSCYSYCVRIEAFIYLYSSRVLSSLLATLLNFTIWRCMYTVLHLWERTNWNISKVHAIHDANLTNLTSRKSKNYSITSETYHRIINHGNSYNTQSLVLLALLWFLVKIKNILLH